MHFSTDNEYEQVIHAMYYYQSGVKAIPPGLSGYFSKTNWGDQIECHDGRNIVVKTASLLAKLVKMLKDKQWEKILSTASTHAKQKNIQMENSGVWVEILSDFDLKDGDEDLLVADDNGRDQETQP
jgi:hypothetical protein